MAKLIHISDLHLGKPLERFSLIDDQKCILEEILKVIDDEKPDALLICGDIYDKKTPSEEAVTLFDGFLTTLSEKKIQTFIISGNHDSADRLAFGKSFLKKGNIYVTTSADKVMGIPLESDPNTVIYGLPFVTPAYVKHLYPDKEISSYTEAVDAVISELDIDESKTNILMSHQTVTMSKSEDISVGGAENVFAGVYSSFDYVALGHYHRACFVDKNRKIRYCGSPLKYSVKDVKQEKSVSVAEIDNGNLSVREIPLKPLRDVVELKEDFETLISADLRSGLNPEDYFYITVMSNEYIPDLFAKLRVVYPNIAHLGFDNGNANGDAEAVLPSVSTASPFEQFAEFFKLRSGTELSDEQAEYAESIFKELENGGINSDET